MKNTLARQVLLALVASLGVYGCSSTGGNDAGTGGSDAASPSDASGGDGEAANDATSPSHDAETGPADANDETFGDAAARDAGAHTQDGATGVDSSDLDAYRDTSADAIDAVADAGANDAGRAPDATDAASAPDVADAAVAPDADASALEPASTAAVLLAAGGDACLTCAEKLSKCVAQSGTCEDLAGLNATGGARDGGPRTELCLETLSCVLQSHCTDLDAGTDVGCYCGSACSGAGSPNGPCLAQELAGTETNDAGALADLANYYDNVRGAGRANGLVACLAMAGCSSCFAAVASDH